MKYLLDMFKYKGNLLKITFNPIITSGHFTVGQKI